MVCRYPHVALAILMGATICNSIRAADPGSSDPVAAIFDRWDKPTDENYRDTQARYVELKQQGNNWRVPYAMALVAAKFHRNPDAAKDIDDALSPGSAPMDVRRMQIWLAANAGDVKTVKSQLRELATALAADPGAAEAQDTAEWFGRALGYYAGPGTDRMGPADLAALEADLKSKLPAPLVSEVDKGRASANQTYAALQMQQAHAREAIKAKLAAAREKEQKQTDAALADATQKRQQAEQTLANLQKQKPKPGKNDPAKAIGKLEKDAVKQEHRAHEDHNRVVDAARSENPERLQDVGRLEANRFNAIERAAADIQKAQNLAGGVSPMPAVSEPTRDNSQGPQEDVRRFQNAERVLTLKKQALANPVNDHPPTEFDARIAAFGTYAGFDLDAEKQKLLAGETK